MSRSKNKLEAERWFDFLCTKMLENPSRIGLISKVLEMRSKIDSFDESVPLPITTFDDEEGSVELAWNVIGRYLEAKLYADDGIEFFYRDSLLNVTDFFRSRGDVIPCRFMWRLLSTVKADDVL